MAAQRRNVSQGLIWGGVAVLGTASLATLALSRGESVNAIWLVVAALCT